MEGSLSAIVGVEELGRRIRKLRIERRMTLKHVEQSCGLSATHLSEIERGRTSPTIGALVRIARALDKEASYFIEAEERPDVAVVPREQVRAVPRSPGVSLETLTPGVPGSRIFAYRLIFDGSGAEFTLPPDELAGVAVYMVRRGKVESEFGDAKTALAEGDAVQATFLNGHRLRPLNGGGAEVIAVLTQAIEHLS